MPDSHIASDGTSLLVHEARVWISRYRKRAAEMLTAEQQLDPFLAESGWSCGEGTNEQKRKRANKYRQLADAATRLQIYSEQWGIVTGRLQEVERICKTNFAALTADLNDDSQQIVRFLTPCEDHMLASAVYLIAREVKIRSKCSPNVAALEASSNTYIIASEYIAGDKTVSNDHSIGKGSININTQYGQKLANCTNMIQQQAPVDRKQLLEQLDKEVKKLVEALSEELKVTAVKNYDALVKEATSSSPDRKWYSVSAEGLLEASKWAKDFTGNIVGTLLNLGKKIWGADYKLPNIL